MILIMKIQEKPNKKLLIIKSGFKTTLKNLGQLIGLGFLVTIAIMVGMSVFITINRVDESYNKLINQSNQHDFIVNVDNSTRISFDENEWIGGENIDEYANQDLYSQYLINVLSRKGIKSENQIVQGDSYFNWSRTEGRTFNNVKLKNNDLNIKALTKTSIIDERFDETKTEQILVDKIILEDNQKDRYFSENKQFASREVIIQANFANQNNIKRGDIIRLTADIYGNQLLVKDDISNLTFGGSVSINDSTLGINTSEYKEQVWFQVIGFGSSADFVYPVTDFKSTIPSIKKNLIAYVDPSIFGLNKVEVKNEEGTKMQIYSYDLSSSKLNFESQSDREVYFSGKFKSKSHNSESYLKAFNKEWIEYGNLNTTAVKMFFDLRDTEYKFYFRTASYRHVIWVYWVFSTFLLILIALISVFIIILIVKKQVDETKSKLGTFKALGYSNRSLLMFFISTPIVISLVGTILGYISILVIQNYIISIFANYFNIHYKGFDSLSLHTFAIFISVLITLTLITLLIAYNVIEQRALNLLAGNFMKRNSKIGRGFKFLFRKANPTLKLHSALLMSSTGKILGTSATLFVSTLLISTAIITPLVMEKNSKATFSGLNYKDVVEFNEPVSNNPSTFLKTYNPIKEQKWSYNQENHVTDISESTNSKQEYITSYPLKYNSTTKTYNYDTDQIIGDLMNNNISNNFYSYNIPIINNNYDLFKEIAKNNYTNWKNTSIEYLKKLDELEIPSRNTQGVPYDSIVSIANQWADYSFLIDSIEASAIKLIKQGNQDGLKETLQKIAQELQNFYKKYINALPLNINSKYLNENDLKSLNYGKIKNINFDDQLFETSGEEVYETYQVKTPFKLATKGTNYLFYGNDTINSKWENFLDDFIYSDFNIENNKIFYNGIDVMQIDLNDLSQWDIEDFRKFNTYIILWYWIHFESKLGTMLMESTYQKETNVIQQAMKEALLKNQDYNIATNIIPYNHQTEELGTMINGTYFSNKNEQNIKIYGLNSNSVSVYLRDSEGTDIKENLFKKLNSDYNEYIPIIINQTISKKLNLGIKDIMNVSILKKELVDKENNSIDLNNVNMGIKSEYNYLTQTVNDYISEHKKNYFAYNELNQTWDSESPISVATINGKKIASETLSGISKETEIQTAANKSEIKKVFTGSDKKFLIVGVTENYGNSKAWISNENANKVLKYDNIKKYFFNKFFLNEWKESPALKKFYDTQTMYEISQAQWEKFIDYFNFLITKWSQANNNDKFVTGADNPYDEFINMFLKLSSDYVDPNGYKYASKYLWKIFENEYPIFNYKYTNWNLYNDQLINTSKTQAFGDYSSIGMVGKSSLIIDNETGTTYTSYTQGYSENSLNKIDSLKDKRELLDQVEAIIRIIIYLITFIALTISIIIIVITTILIIGENAQFIATMKILGYTNNYVMAQILGIYILPIFTTFIFGFLTAWFGIQKIVSYMSSNYSFVIPYEFAIWQPFAVIAILISIYIATILISYKQFLRIKPVDSLTISN
ncbi:ABC transporter permease [Spiroplasma taiwanense]|uniref:ABC transporter permease n=1 Tax=Spiroplasma taiwanense CT-1 TaxID=1276220 RepID=S5LUD6_9MOLU|nr:ABC transporter permease [Spiroplasma taiwanense]AGR41394.1 ABC transporter permease [Spiroplasma taiwanense CT-1]